MQRTNASLHLLPRFLGIAATGDFDIDYCETKNQLKEHDH